MSEIKIFRAHRFAFGFYRRWFDNRRSRDHWRDRRDGRCSCLCGSRGRFSFGRRGRRWYRGGCFGLQFSGRFGRGGRVPNHGCSRVLFRGRDCDNGSLFQAQQVQIHGIEIYKCAGRQDDQQTDKQPHFSAHNFPFPRKYNVDSTPPRSTYTIQPAHNKLQCRYWQCPDGNYSFQNAACLLKCCTVFFKVPI